MNLRSHFVLNYEQRNGILLLLVLILISIAAFFYKGKNPDPFPEDPQIAVFQSRIDSLKRIKTVESLPKIYPFNPNFISDYKGYVLGMSVAEIDKLHQFRKKDQWINSKQDFQRVTGVSDSLLSHLAPFFKFPEWVTSKNEVRKKSSQIVKKKDKTDLNTATVDQLLKVPSLTEELAVRILNYRRRLGGFLEDDQLFDVYGLKPKLVFKLKDVFTVKTVPEITPISVNSATASDLATIPYIPFDIAREIINYRTLHEGISSLEELLKIDGITPYKLDRIKLYLSSSQK